MADVDNLGEGEKSMHFALRTSHFTHSGIEMCPLIGRADRTYASLFRNCPARLTFVTALWRLCAFFVMAKTKPKIEPENELPNMSLFQKHHWDFRLRLVTTDYGQLVCS